MTDRILVPVDGSEHARRAFTVAATTYEDAELVVFHAVDPYDVASVTEPAVWDETFLDQRTESGETLLEEFAELGEEYDVDVRTELAYGGPAHAIIEAVGEFDITHIVMGSRGRRGISRVLLGSVAEAVTRRAPVSVTVVRPDE